MKAALRNQITPILCVGEGLDVRESAGQVSHRTAQLDAALDGLKAEQVRQVVVAYEPLRVIADCEPVRVIADGEWSEVVFTVRQRDGMSDDEFAQDLAAVRRDLKALGDLLQRN